MRSAALAVLAASAAAAAGCGGSSAPSEPASRSSERGSVLASVWNGRSLLARVDAVTLQPRGHALDLGEPPLASGARAPGGGRLALGSGDGARLTIVDLRRMRRLAMLDFGPKGYVAGLAWPSPRRVVAALSGTRVEILVIDPDSRTVVQRHRLKGAVLRSARVQDGLVLLLSPAGGIGPATLALATPAELRTVTLPVEAGVDPPAVFEPGLAVSADGRLAVVVAGGASAVTVDLRTLAVAQHELSHHVSLLGRLRSWLEPAASAKGPLEGPVRSAAWIAGGRIAVAGWDFRRTGERTVSEAAGLRLIDTRNWSVRTLERGASETVLAGDTVLAYGGTSGPGGLRGIGLRGFDSDGRERFHLFGDRYVGGVAVVDRHAYVSNQSASETTIEVVELATGRVVRTVRRSTYLEVLQLD
jgi:hypothetical protein